MRNRLKSVGAGMTRFSRRLAMEITVSAIVMVGLQASGGTAGLAQWLSGAVKTAAAPASPEAAPQAASADGRSGRIDLLPETISVADPAPAEAVDRRRFDQPPVGPDTRTDAMANVSQGASEGASGAAASTASTGGAGEARSLDMTVPAGVVLFTDCLEACDSHDPLLADGRASQGPAASADIGQGHEARRLPAPAPLRLAGLRPERAAAEPAASARNPGAESAGGVTDWLPSGQGISRDIGAIGSGVGYAVRGVGTLVSSVTPW